MNFDRCSRPPFDNNQHFHHQHTADRRYHRHRQEDQNVKSTHHDYSQKEHRNQSVLNQPSLECPLPSNPPLIAPSTRSPFAPPINTTSDEDFILFQQELEQQKYQTSMRKLNTKKVEPKTDKMAPKQTRTMKSKIKDLEFAISSLVKQLRNIKNVKNVGSFMGATLGRNQRIGLLG